MILPLAVILAFFALSIHGKKLHEHMTKEEIESVFNVRHDSIHEVDYDVVPIFHAVNTTQKDRVKRSYRGSEPRDLYIKHRGHEYFLYLEDNSVLLGPNTKIYKARLNRYDKIIYFTPSYYRDYFPASYGMYHDYGNQAALVANADVNDYLHFDGVIGESIHIRSIPDRLHSELKRNYSALLETLPDSTDPPRGFIMNNSTYHIIISKNNNTMDDARNNNISGQQEINEQLRSELLRGSILPLKPQDGPSQAQRNSFAPVNYPETRIRQSPDTDKKSENTVYPEILINVDYSTFRLHDFNTKKIAKYMAAFWNAVDLRYRELSDPEVRLNIAGIIIPEDEFSVPYITSAMVIDYTSGQADYFYNGTKVIIDTSMFLENTFPANEYDVIVVMTSENIKSLDPVEDKLSIADGLAYEGGACSARGPRTAVINDYSDFYGIHVAAHELGHLFNSSHDSTEIYDDCHWNVGYIMSYNIDKHTTFRWSRCSKEQMKTFFNHPYYSFCLKNKPNVEYLYPKILPGKLLSRDDQCFKGNYEMIASKNEVHQADCVRLWCQHKNISMPDGSTLVYSPEPIKYAPAEGTSCGVNKICLDGYCEDDLPLYHSNNLNKINEI